MASRRASAALERQIIDLVIAGLTPSMREALEWLPADDTERIDDGDQMRRSLYGVARRSIMPGVEARVAWSTVHVGRSTSWRLEPFGRRLLDALRRDGTQTEGDDHDAG